MNGLICAEPKLLTDPRDYQGLGDTYPIIREIPQFEYVREMFSYIQKNRWTEKFAANDQKLFLVKLVGHTQNVEILYILAQSYNMLRYFVEELQGEIPQSLSNVLKAFIKELPIKLHTHFQNKNIDNKM